MAISCPLTQGFTYTGCGPKVGGIPEVMFCPIEAKDTITIAAGVVTAMHLLVGEQFRVYDIQKELSQFQDDWDTPNATGLTTFKPTLDMTINSLASSLRQEIKLLSQHRLMTIFKDNNGIYRLAGYNFGMLLLNGKANFGKLNADGQAQVMHFEGTEADPIYEVTPSLIPALIIASV